MSHQTKAAKDRILEKARKLRAHAESARRIGSNAEAATFYAKAEELRKAIETKSKRERGTGRIFLRGTIWWCRFYFHGRQVAESTGETDARKAAKFLRRKLGEIEAGIYEDARRITYADLRANYFRDYEINRRKSLRRDANPSETAAPYTVFCPTLISSSRCLAF